MSASDPRPHIDTETLVRRVIEIIENTRALPLSSSVKLDNKDEVLELLDEAVNRLPDEVRNARWMLKEREEYLQKTQRDAEEIVESARERAGRMVQRTEIAREAHHTARRTLEAARDEASKLRLEAEDYIDQKLASFEIVLERTIKTVAAGRQKLSLTPPPVVAADAGIAGVDLSDDTLGGEDAFFDQDRT